MLVCSSSQNPELELGRKNPSCLVHLRLRLLDTLNGYQNGNEIITKCKASFLSEMLLHAMCSVFNKCTAIASLLLYLHIPQRRCHDTDLKTVKF